MGKLRDLISFIYFTSQHSSHWVLGSEKGQLLLCSNLALGTHPSQFASMTPIIAWHSQVWRDFFLFFLRCLMTLRSRDLHFPFPLFAIQNTIALIAAPKFTYNLSVQHGLSVCSSSRQFPKSRLLVKPEKCHKKCFWSSSYASLPLHWSAQHSMERANEQRTEIVSKYF